VEIYFRELEVFYPFLIFICAILIFTKLYSWIKNRKTGAVIFALLLQIFMPDPYTERTVKVIQVDKKKEIEKRREEEP